MVKIHYLQKSTLQDFPRKIACMVFLSGCNFRCNFCHNPETIDKLEKNITVETFFDFLDSRKNKLQGVVVSGGEPTIHKNIINFLARIKVRDFAIKLDTNGSMPEVLREIINRNLADYIAMDVKAPFSKYNKVAGVKSMSSRVRRSITLLKKSKINYEFRTTATPELSKADFAKIYEQVKGGKRWIIQQYSDIKTFDLQKHLKVYSVDALRKIRSEIAPDDKSVFVRK